MFVGFVPKTHKVFFQTMKFIHWHRSYTYGYVLTNTIRHSGEFVDYFPCFEWVILYAADICRLMREGCDFKKRKVMGLTFCISG